MISGNYNSRTNDKVPYGAIKDVAPNSVVQKLPENIQNLDADTLVKQNDAIKSVKSAKPNAGLLTLPIYLSFVALRSINDNPNSHFSFAGQYDKNFLGRLAKIGDAISNTVGKAVPKSVKTNAPRAAKGAKNWVLKHSGIARSFTTPIKFENSLAASQANGFFGRLLREDGDALFEYGFKGNKDDLIKMFKGDGNGAFWKKLVGQGIEKASDKGAIKIVTETMKEVGDIPVKSKEAQQISKELIEAFSKSKNVFEIGTWHLPFVKIPIGKIPVIGKFFTLKVPAEEYANKIRVAAKISGNEIAGAAGAAAVGTTALGRALPSAFSKMYEGLTSDFIGGKLAPALQAFFLAQGVVKAAEAPKGKKLATFADESVGTMTYLFTMPLATKLLATAAGTKYIGMGKTQAEQIANVAKYRDMIKSLNTKVELGQVTRAEYLNEVKNIKNVFKGKTHFWQKPIKFIGRILGSNMKNETIMPFIDNGLPADASKLKTLGLQIHNNVKTLAYNFKTGKYFGITPGGVLRLGLYMMVISPLVSKPFKWITNKIFGKPYDPVAEKKEAQKKELKAQKEAMKNNPFAKMSDAEFIKLMQANQERMVAAQNDPELMKKLQSNPQALYEFLQEGVKQREEGLKNMAPSSLLQGHINRAGKTNGVQGSNVSGAQISNSGAQTPLNSTVQQEQNAPYSQILNSAIMASKSKNQTGQAQNTAQTLKAQNSARQMSSMQNHTPLAAQSLHAQNPVQNKEIYPSEGQIQQNPSNGASKTLNFNNKAQMPKPAVQSEVQSGAVQNGGNSNEGALNTNTQSAKRTYIPSSEPYSRNKTTKTVVDKQKLLNDIDNTIAKYSY